MSKRIDTKLSSRISKKSSFDNQAFPKALNEMPFDPTPSDNEVIERLRLLDSWTEIPARLDASCLRGFEDIDNKK